jgi:hypothetical protein
VSASGRHADNALQGAFNACAAGALEEHGVTGFHDGADKVSGFFGTLEKESGTV